MAMMPVLINAFFEERLEQLFELAELVERIFSSAVLEYRVVGGLAVYLYVEEAEPDAARLTKDIDIVVRRADLDRIAEAAASFGLKHRQNIGTSPALTCWFGPTNLPGGGPSICIPSPRRNSAPPGKSKVSA
jgi:hypothetical protein